MRCFQVRVRRFSEGHPTAPNLREAGDGAICRQLFNRLLIEA
jgi:hypothetical protein